MFHTNLVTRALMTVFLVTGLTAAQGQVGIGTPAPTAPVANVDLSIQCAPTAFVAPDLELAKADSFVTVSVRGERPGQQIVILLAHADKHGNPIGEIVVLTKGQANRAGEFAQAFHIPRELAGQEFGLGAIALDRTGRLIEGATPLMHLMVAPLDAWLALGF